MDGNTTGLMAWFAFLFVGTCAMAVWAVEVRQARGPWWPLTPKRVEVVDHGAQEIVPVALIEQTMQLPAVRRGGDY